MISKLEIKNFKSVRDLSLDCKKLNIFIGEPNSGKSNIIEAMALQSQGAMNNELSKSIFRYKNISELFYDFNISEAVSVQTDEIRSHLEYALSPDGAPLDRFHFFFNINEKTSPNELRHDGVISNSGSNHSTSVHYYMFSKPERFQNVFFSHLSIPDGENLLALLISNKELKQWVSDFLQSKGLKLTLKPVEHEMLVSKIINDEIYSYPYSSVSETLQRIIFYTVAIMSNKNNTLLFDEPETNTFPLYTKLLGEQIALEESNQYFLTTHNPYLLLNLIEKSKIENVNVCVARMIGYETKIDVLREDQIAEILELNSDVFFGFDRILSL